MLNLGGDRKRTDGHKLNTTSAETYSDLLIGNKNVSLGIWGIVDADSQLTLFNCCIWLYAADE